MRADPLRAALVLAALLDKNESNSEVVEDRRTDALVLLAMAMADLALIRRVFVKLDLEGE